MLLPADALLKRNNYYETSVQRAVPAAPLQGELQTDVLVVGAGFAGLSAALELAQRGYRVVLLEADRVCSGASGRNGGQAIVGYASGQQPFIEQLGSDAARQAWALSLESIALLDRRIEQHRIACDRVHGYLYVAETPRKARALEADLRVLHDNYGFDSTLHSGDALLQQIESKKYVAAAFESVSGHLHPLKYGLGLAQAAQTLGVQIFEHSPVLALQRGVRLRASTPHGCVSAAFGVLAGNCTLAEYGAQVAPEIAARIMPVGTYMIGTAPLDPALCRRLIPSNASVCDNNFILDYYRFSADWRMLFGGRVSYSTRTPRDLVEQMRRRMVQVLPALHQVPVEFVWGGFCDISMNRAPDFGRLGSNLYYLQGFSGHGVALTGLAGQLAAEAIAGQAERFDLFARLQHRRFPGGAHLRTPTLVLGMLYHRLRDWL